jgi:hypothetical protein
MQLALVVQQGRQRLWKLSHKRPPRRARVASLRERRFNQERFAAQQQEF